MARTDRGARRRDLARDAKLENDRAKGPGLPQDAFPPVRPTSDPLRPMTPAEAQAAYDAAVPVPLSKERIAEIVRIATRKGGGS